MPTVFIAMPLRRFTGGQTTVRLPGATLRELIEELESRFPGVKARLVDEDDPDRLTPGLSAIVDGEATVLGLRQQLEPDSEVHFLPAIAGGADRAATIEVVLSDLLTGHVREARATLDATWPFEPGSNRYRRAIPIARRTEIYFRDNFTCRYCGTRTVLECALRVISNALPGQFPYHPNWKRGLTHPAFIELSTSCDHVVPVSRGGPDSLDNLATTCAKCNYHKGEWLLDELGWQLREPTQRPWDGLAGAFVKAMDQTTVSDRSLRDWQRHLTRFLAQ